jgi:multicomponent Na+:H+ antiporter subunit C
LNTVEEVSNDPEDTRVSQLAGKDGAALEDDRPQPDIAKDTDAPDELDALPGLEGSR